MNLAACIASSLLGGKHADVRSGVARSCRLGGGVLPASKQGAGGRARRKCWQDSSLDCRARFAGWVNHRLGWLEWLRRWLEVDLGHPAFVGPVFTSVTEFNGLGTCSGRFRDAPWRRSDHGHTRIRCRPDEPSACFRKPGDVRHWRFAWATKGNRHALRGRASAGD